jgi:uncharacterized protein YecE (DUF72 family)
MQKLRLGTIGWSYNFWRGKFYPNKTIPKNYLLYYASQFNTVEVDSTFYRIPSQTTVVNWRQQTPENFLFSLKFPQMITHVRMLKDCEYETDVFLGRVSLLGDKLGVLLLQFPPTFDFDRLPDLEAYLEKLPKDHRFAVEVRNKNWLNQTFYSILKANRVALAWADNPFMAEIKVATSDFLYFRWEGDRKSVNGTLGNIEIGRVDDLKMEAKKIRFFLSKIDVFGYFGKYYSGYPPSDVFNLQNYLNVQQINQG